MDKHFGSLEQFARFIENIALKQQGVATIAADVAAHALHKNALKIYGDSTKLAPLAQATQDDRVAKGYSPNDPLLRTGELLKDSLEMGHEGPVAGIGSAEPVHMYHEYGYVNARTGRAVPPRPVFREAMVESAPEIGEILQQVVGASLGFGLFPTVKE